MREAHEVGRLLIADGITIATAESLTGGLVAATLCEVPGISAVFQGGVVAYQTRLKHDLLGVDADLLREHGAVHPEVARQMAAGVRRRLGSVPVDGTAAQISLGMATTGVAGPADQDGRTAGTVMIGVSSRLGERALELDLAHLVRPGDALASRADIRLATVRHALDAIAHEITAIRQDSASS